MQSIAVIGFFGFLVWIIMQFGIEHALAVGTVISGVVWLFYRLNRKDYEKVTSSRYMQSMHGLFGRSFYLFYYYGHLS